MADYIVCSTNCHSVHRRANVVSADLSNGIKFRIHEIIIQQQRDSVGAHGDSQSINEMAETFDDSFAGVCGRKLVHDIARYRGAKRCRIDTVSMSPPRPLAKESPGRRLMCMHAVHLPLKLVL